MKPKYTVEQNRNIFDICSINKNTGKMSTPLDPNLFLNSCKWTQMCRPFTVSSLNLLSS